MTGPMFDRVRFRPASAATPRPGQVPAFGFAREERGAMTVLGFMVFVLMVMAAGLAIDAMRHEERRAKLQYVLDRAVLAASSLQQDGDPEQVVRDYVEAGGFDPDMVTVDVTDTIGDRRVVATLNESVDPIFVQLLGIDEMGATGRSKAQDILTDVEIALVLDVSGSMGSNSRLPNLQVAANAFVDTVLTDVAREYTTVSIVPYHASVNVGDVLDGPYQIAADHDASSCATFETSDFSRIDLPAGDVLERIAHFDPWSWDSGWTATDGPHGALPIPECDIDDTRAILPWSNDAAALKARIAGLYARGNTAIDLGVKWGGLMLDPYSAPMLEQLRAAGTVSDDHTGQPFAYDRNNTDKYLVVMTDGQNTTQYDLTDWYKGDNPSGVWMYQPATTGSSSAFDGGDNFDAGDTARYSLFIQSRADEGLDAYWNPETALFQSAPIGGALAFELTYKQLYARLPANYVAYVLATPIWDDGDETTPPPPGLTSAERSRWLYILDSVGSSQANTNLAAICSQVRDAGVTIYTIGFDAPTAGVTALKTCSSSDAHHYDASGTDIELVFRNIAASINLLGLRQ